MKKLAAAVMALTVFGLGANANMDIYVNDVPISVSGFIQDGTTYIPLRAVSEALGATVSWDGKNPHVSMNEDDVVSNIISEASESVVAIVGNYKPGHMSDSAFDYNEMTAHGTGVVIKSGGIILTNAHVVDEIDNITVVFSNGTSYAGTVQYMDKDSDLAVVKINKLGLKPINFGNSSDIIAGRTVIAIGTPLSLTMRNTATKGIISGVDVKVKNSYYPLIQTDAAINPGNSGGPLINMQGKLVGINSSKYSGIGIEGMAFSIPLETINYVLEQFEKNGKVLRPEVGITMEEPWEARIGLPTQKGITVKTSAIDQLRSGDVINAVNGISVHSIIEYNKAIRDTYRGGELSVTFLRNGTESTIGITPELK